jgi:hypothetical protein
MLPGLSSAIVGTIGGVPIQFVGGATAAKAGATSGTSTIALNSGLTGGLASAVSNDDLVIAVFGTGSAADRALSITDGSTDYTLIGSELNSSDNCNTNLRVAYKFVSGDTATTFGPTGNTSDAGVMAVYVFRGVDPTTPLDVSVTTATGTNTMLANPPSITPATAGAFIVCLGVGGHDNNQEPPATFASSDLEDFLTRNADDIFRATIGIGHKSDWTSGAFDASQFTLAAGNDSTAYSWAAMSIALRPA